MPASFRLSVDKSNLRTLHEEHEYLQEQLWLTGNFFAWDVHPNKVKTATITCQRLYRKIRELERSDEFYYG